MTYSDDTINRMDRSLTQIARDAGIPPRPDWEFDATVAIPNIGDTCCGDCGRGLCYVDQVTGA